MTDTVFDPMAILALSPGDAVEVPSPMVPVGMDDVVLIIETVSETNDISKVTMRAMLYDIYLCKVVMLVNKAGEVTWETK